MWKLEPKIKYEFNKLKEEKIKIALEKKKYSKTPENFSFKFLCQRLRDELWELEWELGCAQSDRGYQGKYPPDIKGALKECADISNIIDLSIILINFSIIKLFSTNGKKMFSFS